METQLTPSGGLSKFLSTLTPASLDHWSEQHPSDFIDADEWVAEPRDVDFGRQDLERRKSAFYAAMKRANLGASPHLQWVLDNLTNPFVNRETVLSEFSAFEAELATGTPSIAKGSLMQPLRHRLKEFKLPEYLWDGILIKRFCYSLTAQTGAGKTAIAIRVAFNTARGRQLCGRDIERGTVVYLAGENPADVDMRWLGICYAEGISPDDLDIHTIAGAGNILEHAEQIRSTCKADNIRPAFIIVDTAAAYFSGDDDNHNTQMGVYARQLRELCKLPGEPCVLVLVHPTKGAKDFGDMVPRGGGAFLNEMDGNLGAVRDGATVCVQAVGKFRGPEFTPLHFGLQTVHDCPALFDPTKDRFMPTVTVREMSEAGAAVRAMERETEDIRLVRFIDKNPKASLAQIATELRTNKSKANRMVDSLVNGKLLKRDKLTGKLTLTQTAQTSLNELEFEQKRGETIGTPFMPFPGVPGPRSP